MGAGAGPRIRIEAGFASRPSAVVQLHSVDRSPAADYEAPALIANS